jgi:hypothetical protein
MCKHEWRWILLEHQLHIFNLVYPLSLENSTLPCNKNQVFFLLLLLEKSEVSEVQFRNWNFINNDSCLKYHIQWYNITSEHKFLLLFKVSFNRTNLTYGRGRTDSNKEADIMLAKVLPLCFDLISHTQVYCHISTNSWWSLLPWIIPWVQKPRLTTVRITHLNIIIGVIWKRQRLRYM